MSCVKRIIICGCLKCSKDVNKERICWDNAKISIKNLDRLNPEIIHAIEEMIEKKDKDKEKVEAENLEQKKRNNKNH